MVRCLLLVVAYWLSFGDVVACCLLNVVLSFVDCVADARCLLLVACCLLAVHRGRCVFSVVVCCLLFVGVAL